MAAEHDTQVPEAVRDAPPDGARPRCLTVAQCAPLLLALFAAAHATAAAITITVDEPLYEFCLHAAITLGLAFSFLTALTGRSFTFLGGLIMVAAFAAYALRAESAPLPLQLIYPPEVVGDEETGLAALVAWFLVGFCFMQGRRDNIIFVFVPGVAVFGLMGTCNLNPELFAAFLVFLLASVYGWGYEHFLRVAESHRQHLDWPRWARAHLSRAALVFAIAGIGGALVGNALYYTTPAFHGALGFQQRIWNFSGFQVHGYFMFRDGFRLGSGPIRLSPDPLLKIRAPEMSLWRGRAYDHYDGHGWERSEPGSMAAQRSGERAFNVRVRALRSAKSDPGPAVPEARAVPRTGPMGGGASGSAMPAQPMDPVGAGPPSSPANPSAPGPRPRHASASAKPANDWEIETLRGSEFTHTIEVLGSATAAIFAGPHPYKIEFGKGEGVLGSSRVPSLRTDRYGSLQLSAIMAPGQTYTVRSKRPDFTSTQLRQAPAKRYSREFRERYIAQAGLEVATELGPLVEEITRGAATNYDKAVAIKHYIEEECLYTLNVPRTPAGRDPVVYFVKSSRRGACDMFASAMTLMSRLAGIPARLATGFNTGEYDSQADAIIVRGSDAHAWSELYFPDFGWVPFDLVAARSTETQGFAALLGSGHWRLLVGTLGKWLLVAALATLCVYLAATALTDPRPMLRAMLRRLARRVDPVGIMAADFEALIRLLARNARVRYRAALTPSELLAVAGQSHWLRSRPGLQRVLADLTTAFYDLRYGRRPDPERVADLRREIARARRMLRHARSQGHAAHTEADTPAT